MKSDSAAPASSFLTIQDFLVAELRRAILAGVLVPGQRITEREVSERWRVSKTPVREALAQLEAEGWVRLLPHRGAVVTELSREELEDIYLLRSVIEALAARLAAERMDAPTLERLTKLVDRMERAKAGGPEGLLQLNRKFHDILYERSGRPLVCSTIASLQDKSIRYRRRLLDLGRACERMLEQRRILLEALRRRNVDAVEAAVRDNLNANLKLLLESMTKSESREETV